MSRERLTMGRIEMRDQDRSRTEIKTKRIKARDVKAGMCVITVSGWKIEKPAMVLRTEYWQDWPNHIVICDILMHHLVPLEAEVLVSDGSYEIKEPDDEVG